MKVATIRVGDGSTRAVRIDGDVAIEIPGVADVGELLATVGLDGARSATGTAHPVAALDFAPVVPHPSKIVCVGQNYKAHIAETHREPPQYPTLFAKFEDSLVGAHDDLVRPAESSLMDWEGELAIVIGREIRRAVGAEAEAAIAGYTVANDISFRDWQYRTTQWLQGKMWSASTPVGPVLATPDELPFQARIVTEVDGVVKQDGEIHDLVFGPVALIEYISTVTVLRPGDLILTGTPSGVGHVREPQERLEPGSVVSVEIDGIGRLVNRIVGDPIR